jgi:hypothetical protein
MHPHDGTDVASQIPPTGSDSKVFRRTKTIRVDHKVAVVFVYRRRLRAIARIEELGQCASFDRVYLRHVEPGRVRGDDDLVCLRGEVLAGLVFEPLARRLELRQVLVVVLVVILGVGGDRVDALLVTHIDIILT